jgi:thiamine kinase-like enzyme
VDGLESIVQGLEGRLGPASGSPAPLDGGITNRNYRVRFGEAEYVVRLPGKDTALLGISREAERIANAEAAAIGIAPDVAAADDRCLVTAFVPARPLAPGELQAALEPVAGALRRFHESPVRLPVRFWVPDLLDRYASIVRERGAALPSGYAAAQDLVRRIAGVLPLSDPAPCHNDLLPANVLCVGPDRFLLVDWEYAGMGHRLFDLGNLAVNNELDEAAEERLLAAYSGEQPDPSRRAALKLMRIMSDAREGAWGVVQGVISELDFDFAGYAARHFARLAAAAADPRFTEWIDAASA